MNKKIKQIAKKSGFLFWSKKECGEDNKIDWSSDYSKEFIVYNKKLIENLLDELKQIKISEEEFEFFKENIQKKYLNE